MSLHFYRYLQPLVYNPERHEVSIIGAGGICFRIQDETSFNHIGKVVSLSYSTCALKVPFDKDVAKRVADHRWESGHSFTIHAASLSTWILADAILRHRDELIDSENPHILYRNEEIRKLATSIDEIRATHKRAWQLDSMGKEIIEAIGIEAAYERLQGREHPHT